MEGAGIATAVSQLISFTILLSMFVRKKTACRLSLSSFSGDRRELLMIIKTGFPSLIRQGLSSAATMMLNGQAGRYGDAAVAAMAIVNRICFLIFSFGLGIGQGFQPVAAFNYGAEKYARVKKVLFIPAILILPAVIGLTGVEIAQTAADIAAFFVAVPFVVRFFRRLPADEGE